MGEGRSSRLGSSNTRTNRALGHVSYPQSPNHLRGRDAIGDEFSSLARVERVLTRSGGI